MSEIKSKPVFSSEEEYREFKAESYKLQKESLKQNKIIKNTQRARLWSEAELENLILKIIQRYEKH